MDWYSQVLLRNIGKAFVLPPQKSYEYKSLLAKLSSLLDHFKSNCIDRQKVSDGLCNILITLSKLPPQKERVNEKISVILEFLNPRSIIPKKILDIGAGTGEITFGLKTYYGLPSSNVFAVDQKLPNIVDVTALTYVDNKIPLPDNSIDLIIMFVVLHHIPPEHRDNVISEVYRILSPNGALIIREHDDNKSPDFNIFLDILHLFWYIASSEAHDPLHPMSRFETQLLLKNHGLIPEAYSTYATCNPQRLYHEMYIKNKSITPNG